MENRETWWGDFQVERSGGLHWRIGDLSLVVHRAQREWRLVYGWQPATADAPSWEVSATSAPLDEESDEAERHVFEEPGNGLSMRPALADRPVVSSPRMPLYLAPRQQVTLFVGSPLWARLETIDPSHLITELPIRRPPDTWFGPSTIEGEVCYASKTRAVLDRANLPRLSRHAITPVKVRNDATEALAIESLKLPVPLLSLYEDGEGQLWTEGVRMVRSDVSDHARMEIRRDEVPRGSSTKLLTPKRETAEEGLLIRAFSGLFRL